MKVPTDLPLLSEAATSCACVGPLRLVVVAAGGSARKFQAERRGTVCGEDAPLAARREVLAQHLARHGSACPPFAREPQSSEDSDLSPILRI